MSIEREMLKKVLAFLETDVENDFGFGSDIKVLLAQPEQSEQEPVAWIVHNKVTGVKTQVAYRPADCSWDIIEVTPLYAAPPKREPLSDKEITKNTPKLIHIGERLAFHAGVRFAERHHIIGGEE